MNFDISDIIQANDFARFPHQAGPETDAPHMKLAALIGSQPESFEEVDGVYTAVYTSTRPEVERVVTTSSASQWLTSEVHRLREPVLVWRASEDVLNTARWWQGIGGTPDWSLVRDDEAIHAMRGEVDA